MSRPKKEPLEVVNGVPVWARLPDGRPCCGAPLSTKPGEFCRQTRLKPNGRCRLPRHGGGPGRPPTTGKRSRLWAALGIGAHAAEIAEDPELISHRENVAILEGLIRSFGENVGPTLPIWKEAIDLYTRATEKGDVRALAELGLKLLDGQEMTTRIEKLELLIEQQRKHIDSESRREERLDQSLSTRQAHALVSALMTVIIEEIQDAQTRRRIGERFSRLLGGSHRQHALPGGAGTGEGA